MKARRFKTVRLNPMLAGSVVVIYHNLVGEIRKTKEVLDQVAREKAAGVEEISPELALKKDKAREVLVLGLFYLEAALRVIEPEFKKLSPEDL